MRTLPNKAVGPDGVGHDFLQQLSFSAAEKLASRLTRMEGESLLPVQLRVVNSVLLRPHHRGQGRAHRQALKGMYSDSLDVCIDGTSLRWKNTCKKKWPLAGDKQQAFILHAGTYQLLHISAHAWQVIQYTVYTSETTSELSSFSIGVKPCANGGNIQTNVRSKCDGLGRLKYVLQNKQRWEWETPAECTRFINTSWTSLSLPKAEKG